MARGGNRTDTTPNTTFAPIRPTRCPRTFPARVAFDTATARPSINRALVPFNRPTADAAPAIRPTYGYAPKPYEAQTEDRDCYKCGEKGHLAKDYTNPNTLKVVELDDDYGDKGELGEGSVYGSEDAQDQEVIEQGNAPL